MGSFCPKYTRPELQKYRGVIFHDNEQWCKIWINTDLMVSNMAWGIEWTFITALKSLKFFLKTDIRNLVNFYVASRKSENLHFDGLILSKKYNVLDEKVRKSSVSWHWRITQRKANSWEICIFCVMQYTCSSHWKVLLQCWENFW